MNALVATRSEEAPDVLDGIRTGVEALYQPIVELASDEVVAYEALVRGAVGSGLESPGALFALARHEGLVAELDHLCRTAALDGAVSDPIRTPPALFINIEPSVLAANPAGLVTETKRRVGGTTKVFFEITERALTSQPARLLDTVERLRGSGLGIALDDVGANPRSLALLPLLRPDLVKLDISLIHSHPSRASGDVMNGVCAYAEETGAVILAEGIENEQHLLAANSLGATLGQGWLFGRPGPLPARRWGRSNAPMLELPPRRVVDSPVELVHARGGVRIGRKDVLLSVSRALEAQALALGEYAVIAATFQHADQFTPVTARRYERLASASAFTAALGVGMADPPARGVKGAALSRGDVLLGEWDLAVLGPHVAGALVARDLGDDGPERSRRFEFVLTFDRDLVVDVAASLIARLR